MKRRLACYRLTMFYVAAVVTALLILELVKALN